MSGNAVRWTWRHGCVLASVVCAVVAAAVLGYLAKLHGDLVMQVARQEPHGELLAFFNRLQVVAPILGLLAICLSVAAYQRSESKRARQIRLLGLASGIGVALLSLAFPM